MNSSGHRLSDRRCARWSSEHRNRRCHLSLGLLTASTTPDTKYFTKQIDISFLAFVVYLSILSFLEGYIGIRILS